MSQQSALFMKDKIIYLGHMGKVFCTNYDCLARQTNYYDVGDSVRFYSSSQGLVAY